MNTRVKSTAMLMVLFVTLSGFTSLAATTAAATATPTAAATSKVVGATTTTTTITASNTNPVVNQGVTFTVTLKAGTTGLSAPIKLWYTYNGGPRTDRVGPFSTTNGVYVFSGPFGHTGTYVYHAEFAGDSQYGASSGAVTINVVNAGTTSTTTTITASNTNPVVNQGVTFTVTLKAGTTGLSAPIKLWYTYNGGPRTDRVGPFSTTNGVYVFSGPFGHTGIYVYHAEFAGDSTHAASSADPVTINVGTATTTTITASKTNPAINEIVTFTVTLKSGTTGLSAPIKLWYTYNGGPRIDRPGTFSTTNGVYVFSGPFGHTGTYVYHAEFAGDSSYGSSTNSVTITVNILRPSWGEVKNFTYILQNINLAAIGKTTFEAVVIYPALDDGTPFTSSQINALKYSSGGPKRVLAYLSIGEAENYAWYWNPAWDANNDGKPDTGAPSWLGPSNPQWPGNYEVNYWDPAWQAIMNQSLDKIIAAGFDGVFLDKIDAYQNWGSDAASGHQRATAEQDMVTFVEALAKYARDTRGIADFAIFVLNGEELSSHPDYVSVVTGIGEEEVWYAATNIPQPETHTAAVITYLDIFKQAGKPVFVIDYVTDQAYIKDFYAKARAEGYVPYATVPDLNVLTINTI